MLMRGAALGGLKAAFFARRSALGRVTCARPEV
jgi:hypothetical protein